MNAQVVQSTTCSDLPTVTVEPMNAVGPLDGGVLLIVAATGPAIGGNLNYQWRKEGVDLNGEDQPELNLDPLRLTDAGQYTCVISNDCGETSTIAATVTVTVCRADYDESGRVDITDIFDFLNDWFRARVTTDFNQNSSVEIQDIFMFLNAWFAGC